MLPATLFSRLILVLAIACTSSPIVRAQTAADPAWAALKAGDADKASRLFRRLLSANPSDPLLLLGSGIAAHVLGDDAQAETTLRKALKIDPRLTPASALLGRIVYEGGDLDDAIAIYDRALKGVEGEAEMREQLERWRKEAALHAGFEQGGNGRFAIMFEGPEERALADHISGVLEAGVLEHRPAAERVSEPDDRGDAVYAAALHRHYSLP